MTSLKCVLCEFKIPFKTRDEALAAGMRLSIHVGLFHTEEWVAFNQKFLRLMETDRNLYNEKFSNEFMEALEEV